MVKETHEGILNKVIKERSQQIVRYNFIISLIKILSNLSKENKDKNEKKRKEIVSILKSSLI